MNKESILTIADESGLRKEDDGDDMIKIEDVFLTWANTHFWLLDKCNLPTESALYIFKCGYFSAQSPIRHFKRK